MKKSLLIIPLIGFISILFVTRNGVGFMLDGSVYITGARNILNGNGYVSLSNIINIFAPYQHQLFENGNLSPITQFPPFFPMILALIGKFGIDPLIGARLVNSLLFGINILLLGILLCEVKTNHPLTPFIGQFLFLTSLPLLNVFSWASSEPLFFITGFLGLQYLTFFISTEKKRYLYYSSILISLALFTRYAGIAFVVTGIIFIFIFLRNNYSGKIINSITFGLISFIPITLFIIRNAYYQNSIGNRVFQYHPISLGDLKRLFFILTSFILPVNYILKYAIGLIICLMILRLFCYFLRNPGVIYNVKIIIIFGIFQLFYLIMSIVVISFFDINLIDNSRVFTPILIPAILILTLIFDRYLLIKLSNIFEKSSCIEIIFLCAILIFVCYRGVMAIKWINEADGKLGLSSIIWRDNELLSYLNNMPSDIRIFTNGVDAIYMLTGIISYDLPHITYRDTGITNDRFLDEMNIMKNMMINKQSLFVWFNALKHRELFHAQKEEYVNQIGLELIYNGNRGSIYSLK